jgi:dihydrofolate reductase
VYFRNDLIQTIQEQINTASGDIFCDGGAEIIQQLLNAGLVSEITLSIIPVLLGDGIRLFDNGLKPHNLTLIDSKSFTSGLVQLKYTLSRIW